MKHDQDNVERKLFQHLGLFTASTAQLNASRGRIRERLRADEHAQVYALKSEARPRTAARLWWRTGLLVAGCATLVVLVATVRWGRTSSLATVATADDALYLLAGNTQQPLHAGDAIQPSGVVRAAGSAGAMLSLSDGSRVELRSASELSLERAPDGLAIHLRKGDIVVNAAKQPTGHLYVQTRDMTVSVVGTVFLVNAEDDGSRVGVFEGEVRVHERDRSGETALRPGDQLATSPALTLRPLSSEIAWSRNADAHLAILEAFTRGMTQTAGQLAPVKAGASGQEFEVASIKECDPDNLPPVPDGARGGGANSFQMTPGRTYALCMTLATLIRTAYGYGPASLEVLEGGGRGRGLSFNNVYGLGVEDGRRVRGGPDWVRSQRYTIEAAAGGPADADTMRGPMLRALLERRFQLKAHIETEQIPAFALTVARGGLKMKEGTCTPPDASFVPLHSTTEMVKKNLEAARRGATTSAPCGFAGAPNGPNMIFVGAGAGMPMLGGIVGAPVLDRTGIPSTTRFNYVLEFVLDDSTSQGPLSRGLTPDALRAMQVANEGTEVPRAPNIFTALEQQLGLKLEPARAPREFIVIDRVVKPSPNRPDAGK